MPTLEEENWRITAPVQRIFAGERDPATLSADLDPNSAALVRRILELIAAPYASGRSVRAITYDVILEKVPAAGNVAAPHLTTPLTTC